MTSTESGFYSDQKGILMSGSLKKKGKKTGGMKTRYYVIKGNFMFYFKQKGDTEPKGVMYLPGKLFSMQTKGTKNFINVY